MGHRDRFLNPYGSESVWRKVKISPRAETHRSPAPGSSLPVGFCFWVPRNIPKTKHMTLAFRDSRTHRFADPATVRDPTLCSSQESVALGDPADHT